MTLAKEQVISMKDVLFSIQGEVSSARLVIMKAPYDVMSPLHFCCS